MCLELLETTLGVIVIFLNPMTISHFYPILKCRQVSVGRAEVVSVETSKVVSGEEGQDSVVRLVLGQGSSNNLRPGRTDSLAQLSLASPP